MRLGGAVARRRMLGALGVIGFLSIWQGAAALNAINTLLLSSPVAIVVAAVDQVQDATFWAHIGLSAAELGVSLALSAVVGIALGVFAGWSKRANYIIDPWLTILYSTPTVAIAPLMVIAFGIDFGSKVAIIFLFAMPPVAVNAMGGVKATANAYLRVAKSFNASDWAVLRTVVMPGALPYILAGMRVAGGRALVGLVVAELIAGNAGIGYLLNLAGATFNTSRLMFMIFILGMIGVLYTLTIQSIEERLAAWRPARA